MASALRRWCLIGVAMVLSATARAGASPLSSSITYQGQLKDGGSPVNNPSMPMSFSLYDAAASGNLIDGPLDANVEVVDGLFTVDLDFGAAAFDGQQRWLEITVDGATLSPRQEVTAAPYALQTRGLSVDDAGNLGIGTASPEARLHVAGDTKIDGNNTLEFGAGIPGKDANAGKIGYQTFSNALDIVGAGTGGNRRIQLWGEGGVIVDGSVGIGAPTPGSKLQVNYTPLGGVGIFAGDLNPFGNAAFETNLSTPDTHLWCTENGAPVFNVRAGGNTFIAGNVGIGTEAPGAKLHIAGTPDVDGIMFPDGTLQTTAAGAAGGQMQTLELTGGATAHAVVGWGDNEDGSASYFDQPLTAIAAGGGFSLGIEPDSELVGWGSNYNGILDLPCCGPYVAVAAGDQHALALQQDGTIAAWGFLPFGEGNFPPGTYTAISAGKYFSVAIKSDGTLAAAGNNDLGQTDVPGGTFVAIDAGVDHTVAIRTDGTLAAWGDNSYGQGDVPAGSYVAVGAGRRHSVAIRSDGTLAAWGANSNGELEVPSGAFTAISAGWNHTLAIRTDGTLVAWGDECEDSLEVPPGTFQAIASGYCYNLAIPTEIGPPALKLLYDAAFKPGTNTWTISSDSRLKKNIRTLEGSLDKMLQLRGVTFDWRDPASQGGRTGTEMGMIADEIEQVFPQWVGRDAKGYRTLTVGGFEGLTAEALRELRAEKDRQIDALRAENAELRERLIRIEGKLQQVED